MPTRAEVYAVIDGEREYQDQKWDPAEHHVHNVTEWLVYMEDYINEAKRIVSRRPDPEAVEFALHTVRKVGAMAVACLEQNGVRSRNAEGPRVVGYVEQ